MSCWRGPPSKPPSRPPPLPEAQRGRRRPQGRPASCWLPRARAWPCLVGARRQVLGRGPGVEASGMRGCLRGSRWWRRRAAASSGFRPGGGPEGPPPATAPTCAKYQVDEGIKSWPKPRKPRHSLFAWRNALQPWSPPKASDFPRTMRHRGSSTWVRGDISQAGLAKPALKRPLKSAGSRRRG